MADYSNIQQYQIGEDGQLVPMSQPLTWDGEPVWSQDTIRKGLFSVEAFEQLPGQLAIGADDGEL